MFHNQTESKAIRLWLLPVALLAALLLCSCGEKKVSEPVTEPLPHSYIYNATRVEDASGSPEVTLLRTAKDAALALQVRYPASSFESASECYQVVTATPVTGNQTIDNELELWSARQRNSQMEEFKANCGDSPRPAQLYQTYENSFTRGNAISVLMFTSVDTGGAHPATGITSMSFDMRDGKKLEYADIFATQEGLLEFLSDYAYRALKPNLGQFWEMGDMFVNGLKPEPENFKNFALVPDGLVIIFPAYQAAPYSAGIQSFFVPLTELIKFRPLPGIWQ
ncbi:DUF3298 and DUF4163 domain-containing protein [Desulfovibrio sp. OttesenSCG-928-C06]|nr:DUF3298 and DUF4163 domain-containing protein [Desulfovibrio sp. OttesenSCG-928-C06]